MHVRPTAWPQIPSDVSSVSVSLVLYIIKLILHRHNNQLNKLSSVSISDNKLINRLSIDTREQPETDED